MKKYEYKTVTFKQQGGWLGSFASSRGSFESFLNKHASDGSWQYIRIERVDKLNVLSIAFSILIGLITVGAFIPSNGFIVIFERSID